jgi:hypothetical protein
MGEGGAYNESSKNQKYFMVLDLLEQEKKV